MRDVTGPRADAAEGEAVLFERDRELERIHAALRDAGRERGSVTVIEGPPGIGKTALVAAGIAAASASGLRPLRSAPGELEAELPWGVVRDLFGRPGRDEPARALLEGAAAAAAPALGAPGAASLPPGPDAAAAVLHGLYWLTANLAASQPFALFVDDAQWADVPSLSFLAYIGQRVGDLPVALLVARRPAVRAEAEPPLRALAAAGSTLRPQGLSEAGTGALLRLTRGREPDAELARRCHRLCAGNPFLVRELGLELEGHGDGADGEAVVPERVADSVDLRLRALPDPAAGLAACLAVLGGNAEPELAGALAGLGPDEVVAAAESLAAADLAADEVPLAFVHPLVRSAVYDSLPAPRRERLHARAAEELVIRGKPASEIAAHVHATAPGSFAGAADVLLGAGTEALASGVPVAAGRHLLRALEEPAPASRRVECLVALAGAEAATGDPRAPQRIEEALELVEGGRARATLLKDLTRLLYAAGRFGEGVAAADRGLAELDGSDPGLEVELRGMRSTLASFDAANADETFELLAGLEERDPAELDPAEREVLTQAAVGMVFASEDHERARSLALRALGDGAMLESQGLSISFSVAVSALTWSDAYEEAEAEIERAMPASLERGALIEVAYLMFGRCQVRYWQGRIPDAAADAETAVKAWADTGALQLPSACCWLAMARLELDDVAGAARALEIVASSPRELQATESLMVAHARARIASAQGDFEAAWRELEPLTAAGESLPTFFRSAGYLPWRAAAATIAAAAGRAPDAARWAGEELELARRFGAPRPLGIALRARGLADGGDVARLEESASVLAASAARLEEARTRMELGASHRRAGRLPSARVELAKARDAAEALGAVAVERRATEELAAAGARSRRRRASGPESLTPSERRVAQLAASGVTNREIAQRLFVSLRTVETHLTAAYRKLRIDSRAELAGALAGERPSGR